jgi:HEAT repeat protein
MKELRELANNIPNASAAEQERVSLEIAQAVRAENDPVIRGQLLKTIGGCDTRVASMVLAAGVRDSESSVRIACCEAMGRRGASQNVRLLGEVLTSDTDLDVRLAAARALGEVQDPAAAPMLAPALEDPDPALQARAMRSLEKATNQDFGNDVEAWRQYVRGETPQPRTQSFASRWRQLW